MTTDKLTLILFLSLTTSCSNNRIAELSFDTCKIRYTMHPGGQKELYPGHDISNEMEFESARRKLALCLCDRYIQTQEKVIKAKILEILKAKENYFSKPLGTELSIDTILVHKDRVFDPTILVD